MCAPVGVVGPQSMFMKRGGAIRAAWRLFLEKKTSPTLTRGAAAPVSSGMRLSHRAGMVASATNPGDIAVLARFSGYIPEDGRLCNSAASAHAAHSGSHSVVSNRRKLRFNIPKRLPRVRIARSRVNREGEAKRP